jgi:hypothetical protein
MRILVDSLGSQVQVQLQGTPPLRRLNTLYGAMRSAGASLTKQWSSDDPGIKSPEWEVGFSNGPITESQLEGCDVFFVMTHHPVSHAPDPAFQWSEAELDAITSFVAQGGGLLLMSNHQPYPLYDIELAARFGIVLNNVYISQGGYMAMSGDLLNAQGFSNTYLFAVDGLAAHDSCGISFAPPSPEFGGGTWIAKFPPGAVDGTGQALPSDWYYSVLAPWQKGKVIVIGNSGTVGDSGGTPSPSCGMVTYANNLMFVLNCLRLLGGQPQAPFLGCCPGGTG